jgi:CRISPR-associated protein Cas2
MTGTRHRLLVCYDIRDPVRLRRTHATMLGYGDPVQYSVFLCELSSTEAALMEAAVLQVMRPTDDSVLIVDLGPAAGAASKRIRTLGTATISDSPRYHVV